MDVLTAATVLLAVTAWRDIDYRPARTRHVNSVFDGSEGCARTSIAGVAAGQADIDVRGVKDAANSTKRVLCLYPACSTAICRINKAIILVARSPCTIWHRAPIL